jgi:hypothetical protein
LAPRRTATTRQENEETVNHPWTASPKNRPRSLLCSQKTGRKWSDQLEEAYTAEITKLVDYVDRKEDPLLQTVRTHQRNIKSAMLQTPQHRRTEGKKTNKGTLPEDGNVMPKYVGATIHN